MNEDTLEGLADANKHVRLAEQALEKQGEAGIEDWLYYEIKSHCAIAQAKAAISQAYAIEELIDYKQGVGGRK